MIDVRGRGTFSSFVAARRTMSYSCRRAASGSIRDARLASEIVLGTLVAAPRGWRSRGKPTPDGFKALFVTTTPGFAPAVMNFRIEDAGPAACTLTTETRVYVTDPSTRRRFALYWRVIYPGSALIRHMWLRAVAHRAEAR